jgi:hypothetical protein
MVAHQVEKGLVVDELTGAPDGVRVAPGVRLAHKRQPHTITGDQLRVGLFIPWPYHDTDFGYTRPQRFPYDETEYRSLYALLIEQRLHRQSSLRAPRGRDHGLSDSHK